MKIKAESLMAEFSQHIANATARAATLAGEKGALEDQVAELTAENAALEEKNAALSATIATLRAQMDNLDRV